MFVRKLIFFGYLLIFSQSGWSIDSKDILPPEQAFKFSAQAVSPEQLELVWEIADGYHLYKDKFKFQSQTEGIALANIDLPPGKQEHDEIFGDTEVYRNHIKLTVPLLNNTAQHQVKILVKYQGCADIGVCYPPQKQVVELVLPTAVSPNQSSAADNSFLKGFKNLAPGLFNSELLPPEQAFQFFANVKDDHSIHINWLAAEGYYLYKDKLVLNLNADTTVSLGKYVLPVGEAHQDPEFGQVEIYRQDVSVDVPLLRSSENAESIILTTKYQGCADRGVCYPPMQSTVTLNLPALLSAPAKQLPEKSEAVLSEQDQIVKALKQDGLGLTLFSFFGFGLLLAFTPCIFPMIPILSGIIVGHGHQISTRKAFLLSLSYVVASALMYTLFGILAALFGSNLQAAFQNPWVIGAFSSLFVVLSFSMFGFYHLELPKSLQSMLHNSSEKHRDGSYLGAGIMGALSSLIVGPCVAAPLAAALIYIGQTGDVLLGGSALFAMGLGMGLPLLLLGASAGKLLPKAGDWLNSTKAVFGVIMLGVAVWMLSRIVPTAVTMLLSAMLLIIPAIYLSAIDPLPAAASGWHKLWKGIGILMLVFGILQLIGFSAGSTNLLQPLQGLVAGSNAQAKSTIAFQRVHSVTELDAKIQSASQQQQPVMLDFYADWCVSCKEMEAYTFTDPEVQRQLSGFVLLQADVTENNAEDKVLLKRYGLIGPPGIIFIDSNGQERPASRVIGYQDASAFVKTLQQQM